VWPTGTVHLSFTSVRVGVHLGSLPCASSMGSTPDDDMNVT
jgi:hypothetical protein